MKPFSISVTRLRRLIGGMEQFAREDGIQRGVFFDTSGKVRCERVSATSTASWLGKTKAGKPYEWGR